MIIFHLASIHLFGFWIHNLIGGSITSGDCSGPLPQLLQVDCISSSTLMGKARSEGYRQAEHCVVLLGEGGKEHIIIILFILTGRRGEDCAYFTICSCSFCI